MCKILNFPFVEEFFFIPSTAVGFAHLKHFTSQNPTFALVWSSLEHQCSQNRQFLLLPLLHPSQKIRTAISREQKVLLAETRWCQNNHFFKALQIFGHFSGKKKAVKTAKKITVFKIFKINYL